MKQSKWTALCLLLLTQLFGFLGCQVSRVELSDNFPQERSFFEPPNTADASPESISSEPTQEPTLESTPERPVERLPEHPKDLPPNEPNCSQGKNNELRWLPLPPSKGNVLLLLTWKEMSLQQASAIPPKGWSISPRINRSNSQGEFPFLVNREETPTQPNEQLRLKVGKKCRIYPLPPPQKSNQRQLGNATSTNCDLKGENSFSCPSSQISTFIIPIKGKLKEDKLKVLFSPEQSAVLFRYLPPPQKGKPELALQIQCKAPGQLNMFLAGEGIFAKQIQLNCRP